VAGWRVLSRLPEGFDVPCSQETVLALSNWRVTPRQLHPRLDHRSSLQHGVASEEEEEQEMQGARESRALFTLGALLVKDIMFPSADGRASRQPVASTLTARLLALSHAADEQGAGRAKRVGGGGGGRGTGEIGGSVDPEGLRRMGARLVEELFALASGRGGVERTLTHVGTRGSGVLGTWALSFAMPALMFILSGPQEGGQRGVGEGKPGGVEVQVARRGLHLLSRV
jgi:hypothetical protein